MLQAEVFCDGYNAQKKRLIDFIANNIDANQRVNCGLGLQVWSAVYTLAGPHVRKFAGPHYTRAQFRNDFAAWSYRKRNLHVLRHYVRIIY